MSRVQMSEGNCPGSEMSRDMFDGIVWVEMAREQICPVGKICGGITGERNVWGERLEAVSGPGINIWILMRDYKSPCVAVVIYSTLLTYTHADRDRQLLTSYTINSAKACLWSPKAMLIVVIQSHDTLQTTTMPHTCTWESPD